MHNRAQLEPLMTYLAWISRLGLDDERAAEANCERAALLTSLSDAGTGYAFHGTKPHYGRLSPGCWSCGRGTWSCLFLNRLCTANCFFCPQDKHQGEARLPNAEEIAFASNDAYVEYLRKFGFRGVGISGGETFLAFDRLVGLVEAIRRGLGPAVHVWVYSNGDLVDQAGLKRLRSAGLDEIRLNISARGYDLRPVALARGLIETVTVEIPVLPEDHAAVERCMLQLDELGVDHLNLHQLVATPHNYSRLVQRNYTFLPPMAFHEAPALESETVALRLLLAAAERGMSLAVHYCSHAYKARFQTLARRKRGAQQVCTAWERITEAGYIRRLSVVDSPDQIARISGCLLEAGADRELWAVDESGQELHFAASLQPVIPLAGRTLAVRYFEAHIVSQGYLRARGLTPLTEVTLAPGESVWIGRKMVAHRELRDSQIPPFVRFVSETEQSTDQHPFPATETPSLLPVPEAPASYGSDGLPLVWDDLISLESLSQGVPPFPSRTRKSGRGDQNLF